MSVKYQIVKDKTLPTYEKS